MFKFQHGLYREQRVEQLVEQLVEQDVEQELEQLLEHPIDRISGRASLDTVIEFKRLQLVEHLTVHFMEHLTVHPEVEHPTDLASTFSGSDWGLLIRATAAASLSAIEILPSRL